MQVNFCTHNYCMYFVLFFILEYYLILLNYIGSVQISRLSLTYITAYAESKPPKKDLANNDTAKSFYRHRYQFR